ncbi:MAG: disulfide bond formation protein B [Gaiellaceae bacterium]|jgi:disulfide bond formation protein DsbB
MTLAASSTTRDALYAFSGLGVAGQVLVGLLLLIGVLALLGVRAPLAGVRRWLWGYELWAGFVVAAIATGGSLFYSQIANFQPCELCWFQRICMYPLSILLLILAWHGDNRAARYLLPLPVVGAGVSIYHMLIGYGAIKEPSGCFVGAPAGCGFNWIGSHPDASFGYLQIETLALTGFLLLIGFLVLAGAGEAEAPATLPAHAER